MEQSFNSFPDCQIICTIQIQTLLIYVIALSIILNGSHAQQTISLSSGNTILPMVVERVPKTVLFSYFDSIYSGWRMIRCTLQSLSLGTKPKFENTWPRIIRLVDHAITHVQVVSRIRNKKGCKSWIEGRHSIDNAIAGSQIQGKGDTKDTLLTSNYAKCLRVTVRPICIPFGDECGICKDSFHLQGELPDLWR